MVDVESLVTIGGAAFSSALSVSGLGWWLRGKFTQVDNNSQARWLDHEEKDQNRHEDNLKKFSGIAVALAQLGWRNGTSGH